MCIRDRYSHASALVGLTLGLSWAVVSLYTGFVVMIGVNWLLPLN